MEYFAVAFGSNLGDREEQLNRALSSIDTIISTSILITSSVYRSAPWGDTDQPEFRNAIAIGVTELSPIELLAELQRIENHLGKTKIRQWGPRAIDLDLLLFGEFTEQSTSLTLPHPHIRQRPFVYEPLAECLQRLSPNNSWLKYAHGDEAGTAIEADTARMDSQSLWPAQFTPRDCTIRTSSEEATAHIGEALGHAAQSRELFALVGPLGAGKSCLARGIAHGLGITGPIPSPTYTLCREYNEQARVPFHHWDFYRLQGTDDLESTAFSESKESGAVLAVEWADLFEREFPAAPTTWIRIDRSGELSRKIRISFPPGSLHLRKSVQHFFVTSGHHAHPRN